jgi:hypothetical protein
MTGTLDRPEFGSSRCSVAAEAAPYCPQDPCPGIDEHGAAAIVDRLTFNGAIIETGTDSYRLAHTIAQQTR